MQVKPLQRSSAEGIVKLDRLSRLMDESIRLPGGYRIGWDGILGLIPGIGDLAGLLISLHIVKEGYRAGASSATLVRMLLNVLLETAVGAVPILGDLFDLVFKSNMRNMRLLKRQMSTPADLEKESSRTIALIGVGFVIILVTVIYLTFRLISFLIGAIF